MLWSINVAAQFEDEPEIHEDIMGKDANHKYESLGDKDLSHLGFCYTLDGEYVGPVPIGINLYEAEVVNAPNINNGLKVPFTIHGIGRNRDSLVVDMLPRIKEEKGNPYMIGGRKISVFINYKSLKGKVNLLTLDEVRHTYCPNEKGPFIFMINKFFIMRQPELYKIDKDFIYRVEILHSKDFTAFKKRKNFTIIRIFTKTHHNWHQSQIQ